jgi:competence protein ComEC
MTIVILTVAWMIGIWLASVMEWPPAAWLATAVFPLLLALIFRRRQGQIALLLACLAALAFGGARYAFALPQIDAAHLAFYNDTPGDVGIIGVVVKEPDVHDRHVNLRVAAEQVSFGDGTTYPVTGLLLVRANRFPEVPYGARVGVNGRLETPPEGEEFSYKAYLARQGVHSFVSQGRVGVLAEGQGHPLLHAILALKAQAQATINRLIPEPEAALLSGILLGNDNNIPPDLAQDFRDTGMTHIIAISGFNIAILIAIMVSLADPFLARRTAVLVAVVGIFIYTILVGAEASVVRAAVMGSLFLFTSRWLGRPNFPYASLFFAALVMTLLNPMTLWDVGFQLSFAATLGLMLYADPFTQWTQRRLVRTMERPLANRVMGVLSEAVLLTLAAQILTLPLMIGYFRQLSLISLPANAMILPFQPGVMLWGGAATLAGLVWLPLGQPLAWVAWLFLALTVRLVQAFAAVPWAAVPVYLPIAALLALYALIAAATWYVKASSQKRTAVADFLRQNQAQRLAFSGSVLLLFLLGGWSLTQPDGRLHIAFLDVGQGDAIFIQTPGGRQVLVDGGNFPSVLNDQLSRQMPFWDREIDLLVATHPDADHVTGLTGVFDRYRVGRLLTNGQGLNESSIYDAVLLTAEARGTPIQRAQAGQVIELGDGVRLEALHPGEILTDDRNENSVVLRLVYGDFSLLLTGDADEDSERVMVGNGRSLHALILKAGHHGSNTSTSAPFLEAVRPQIVIISAGKDNRFGHPNEEVLERITAVGAVVLRTDELGTIEVTTDGQQMWWRAGPKR